jgi:catechol 2,3-dioxygenase-like lactoylglutathione lyase family enzyme
MVKAHHSYGETMFKDKKTFSSFSVDDLPAAHEFYAGKLGLDVITEKEGLAIKLAGGADLFIYPKKDHRYPKKDHRPATFTVLNFKVSSIDEAVDELVSADISLETFGGDIQTDAKGIFRGKEINLGPNIAWFRDPAGNFLSVVESSDIN